MRGFARSLQRAGATAALAAACAAPVAAQQPASDEQALLDRLAQDPADGEARLALAWLDYDNHRDQTAEFNARQALASGLTPDQAERARDLLAALQRRRTWIYSADVALAPEATRDFVRELDPDDDTPGDLVLETRRSGFGAVAAGFVERRMRLGEDLRLSTALSGSAAVYEEGDFDAFAATLFAGPLFLHQGDDRTGVRALLEQRWLGGEAELSAYGGEIFTQRSVSDTLRAFARLTLREVDDARFDSRDGQTYGIDGSLARYGLSGRFEQVFGLVFRSQAEAANQSFWFARLGAGAYRETAFGLGVYVEPAASIQSFDGVDPIGGGAREDIRYDVTGRVVKRDWRLFGSSPYAAVAVSWIDSNFAVYDDDRVTATAGFTRTF